MSFGILNLETNFKILKRLILSKKKKQNHHTKPTLCIRYILSATQGYYHSYNANQLLHSQTQPFSLHHNSTMLDKVSSTFSHHQNHQLQQSYFASSAMSVSRSTSPFPRKL